jgi:hypothetical protein
MRTANWPSSEESNSFKQYKTVVWHKQYLPDKLGSADPRYTYPPTIDADSMFSGVEEETL